jgi:hypothetical protein
MTSDEPATQPPDVTATNAAKPKSTSDAGPTELTQQTAIIESEEMPALRSGLLTHQVPKGNMLVENNARFPSRMCIFLHVPFLLTVPL